MRLDPVYRAIAGELPDAITVVDLGTGLATLPILLALLGTRRTVIGFEWDAKKADAGRAPRGSSRSPSRARRRARVRAAGV